MSFTKLRNSLRNDTPEEQLNLWSQAFDVKKLGVDWIQTLIDFAKQGMGLPK